MNKEDLFAYCLGGLAIISTVTSVALYSQSYLPGAQIRVLNELLCETRQIYDKSRSDGLLSDEFRGEFEENLAEYVYCLIVGAKCV